MLTTFPDLHTNRLDLVEIKQEHVGDIFKLFSDDKVTEFYNLITFKEEQEAQKCLDWFSSRFSQKMGIRWGICLKGKNHIIGTIGFNNFTPNHRANLGYDLQFEFWNQGYITEVLRAVIKYGFQELTINRIEAEVMQGNVASEKVLTKLGFAKEGILRQWMLWNEKHYDMTMYSLLQSEFDFTADFKK